MHLYLRTERVEDLTSSKSLISCFSLEQNKGEVVINMPKKLLLIKLVRFKSQRWMDSAASHLPFRERV